LIVENLYLVIERELLLNSHTVKMDLLDDYSEQERLNLNQTHQLSTLMLSVLLA
jgi:hypothetical protein